MSKKEIIIKLLIILAIFIVGFLLRLDTIHLSGVPDDEKAFFEDQNGLPYMYEIDSYYNYRMTQDYINHGYLGDTILNGTEWDLHSYYPPGRSAEYPPLLIYITTFIYKLINLVTSIPLLTICFWIPAIIAPLCGIPAYLLVSKLTNDYGGFAAGILAVTAPFYFMRSIPGWFDTDILNILFPVLIVWFFIEAVNSKNREMQFIYALLSAFSMFLFQMAWEGWIYLFYLIITVSVVYIIINLIRKNNFKNFFTTIIIFLMGTVILIYIFKGISGFETLRLPFGLINEASPVSWYYTYNLVSELQIPSTNQVLVALWPFLLAILFTLFLNSAIFVKTKKNPFSLSKTNLNLFFYLFIAVWILVGFISLIKGIRFIILLIPPFAILSGFLVGITIKNLKALKIQRNLIKIMSLMIIFSVAVTPLLIDYDNAHSLIPRVNDDLGASAQWINQNTDENTVVISYWVQGYFFEAVANRPLTYDGGSQNTIREYWIDHALATDNESLSIGIFRMLTTSGDSAYLTLQNYTKNTTKTVEILNNILGLTRAAAKEILIQKYNLNTTRAENILKYTHPEKNNHYLLVTYNPWMTNIGNWIFYLGNWNFSNNSGHNYTYSVGTLGINNNNLNSDNNITGKLYTNDITWNGKTPYCEITVKNNKIEKHYLNKNSDFCIFLLTDSNTSVVLDKRLENSMFTKLVLEKSNSTTLKPVYKNNDVIVWKLNN